MSEGKSMRIGSGTKLPSMITRLTRFLLEEIYRALPVISKKVMNIRSVAVAVIHSGASRLKRGKSRRRVVKMRTESMTNRIIAETTRGSTDPSDFANSFNSSIAPDESNDMDVAICFSFLSCRQSGWNGLYAP